MLIVLWSAWEDVLILSSILWADTWLHMNAMYVLDWMKEYLTVCIDGWMFGWMDRFGMWVGMNLCTCACTYGFVCVDLCVYTCMKICAQSAQNARGMVECSIDLCSFRLLYLSHSQFFLCVFDTRGACQRSRRLTFLQNVC